MAKKIRLGIFLFVFILICIVMVASKEKLVIQKLCANESEILFVKNEIANNSFCFKTNFLPEEIIEILDAKILSTQNIENLKIYYCFVENVNNFIVIDEKKVNLQIAYNGNNSIVGFPIIQTGY